MSNTSYQRIAVIGLGRFGMALAKRLAAHGAEVIAIDSDQKLVDEISDAVDMAVRLDSTDEAALRSQEIDRVDCVVVSIGENFEAALLTTVLCKRNLKVPHVICRAQTELHAMIFQQIGADEVIQPEQHAGEMLGRRLAHPRIRDYITLGDGFTVVEMLSPSSFAGKSLRQIDLRSNYQVNLIAIRRKPPVVLAETTSDGTTPVAQSVAVSDSDFKPETISVPGPNDLLEATDVLLLAGSETALASLPQN